MKYTFRPYHITVFSLTLAAVVFIIWAFSSGYDCGFYGHCSESNTKVLQGFFRISILVFLVACVLLWSLVSDYEKEITVHNPFKSKVDIESEALYQEWLSERKKQSLDSLDDDDFTSTI
jgi:uncharacterized membrane protein YjgN (DUF898 family)